MTIWFVSLCLSALVLIPNHVYKASFYLSSQSDAPFIYLPVLARLFTVGAVVFLSLLSLLYACTLTKLLKTGHT